MEKGKTKDNMQKISEDLLNYQECNCPGQRPGRWLPFVSIDLVRTDDGNKITILT